MPSFWTCPRCHNRVEVASPASIPANCARCNYPDPLPTGVKLEDVVDDLEAEVGEEQRRMAEAQKHAPNAPDAGDDGRAPGREQDPDDLADIDRGWLAICVREAIDTMMHREGHTYLEPALEPAVVHELAQLIATTYDGDRWEMICGCLAGEHGDSFAEIREAHPERRYDRA